MTSSLAEAEAARKAQRNLGRAAGAQRSAVLETLASLLLERTDALIEANRVDLKNAEDEGLSGPLRERLALTATKIQTLTEGIRQLAALSDPLERVLERRELDDGLLLTKVRSPLGVLLVIFESRPDAVIQIGSLALRAGNAVLLKGGSEALHTNRALIACLRDALSAHGFSPDGVQGVEGRSAVASLLEHDDLIDLVIPRGSNELVRSVQRSTRIPVLGHAEGICHVYLDRDADASMAARIVVDAKCSYPTACNAVETLLVHQDFLPHLSSVGAALRARGVALRADPRALSVLRGATPATEDDWSTEYGDLILAIRVVDDLDAAIAHIHQFGSGHTEAIVTSAKLASDQFLRDVDAASVFVNASTRFADGYRYGLGAEVGISTSRIHARGPVGVEGLTTTRWLLEGNGNIVEDYGPGKRSFTHRPLLP